MAAHDSGEVGFEGASGEGLAGMVAIFMLAILRWADWRCRFLDWDCILRAALICLSIYRTYIIVQFRC